MIVERLKTRWPDVQMTLEHIHTRGDRNTDVPLTQIGSDGVFVAEIERSLLDRRIDLAVHSLKDLPTAQPDGLRIVVAGQREDVRDVLVFGTNEHIDAMKLQEQLAHTSIPLRIGTCSLRRTAQVLALCPDAQILPLRGNVDTRLRKLDAGEYDAIVLAAAGLHRLSLSAKLAGRMSYFPIETLMPAPGQGALALEMRDEPEMLALVAPLVNSQAQAVTSAERMFMRRLGAGCYLPVAAYGEIDGGSLTLRGRVISLDGRRQISVQRRIPWTAHSTQAAAEQLGVELAELALAKGAGEIIAEIIHVEEGREDRGDKDYEAALPLKDMRVLVTRAGEQAGAMSEKLAALGAIPVEFPTIQIEPPGDWEPLDEAARRLFLSTSEPYYSWLIFTSSHGVSSFFERVSQLGFAASSLKKVKIAVIGSSTAATLERYGLHAALVPEQFVAEAFVEAILEDARRRGESLAGKRVLLGRAAEARDVLPARLQAIGVLLDDIPVYRNVPVAGNDARGREVLRLLREKQLDVLTFTSSSTVRNFVNWLSETDETGKGLGLVMDNPRLHVACIGPVTARTARELGLPVHIEAQVSTIDGLIEAIQKYEEHRT